jgi:hypothetical protein
MDLSLCLEGRLLSRYLGNHPSGFDLLALLAWNTVSAALDLLVVLVCSKRIRTPTLPVTGGADAFDHARFQPHGLHDIQTRRAHDG